MEFNLFKMINKDYRLFSNVSNIKVSIKNGSDDIVPAIIDRDNKILMVLQDEKVAVGSTIVDEVENKYTAVSVIPSNKDVANKNGEYVNIKTKEIRFVVKPDDKMALTYLVKQEAVNNSNIHIESGGNVTISGDVGSINAIQQLDLQTYWQYLKHDINELFNSKEYKSEIKEIDDYFTENKKPNVEKIKKSFGKILIDSIRNFALDYLVKLTIEMGKQ